LGFRKRRSSVYEAVKRELDEGRQAYVVAPLIEESESIEAAAATSLYEELCSTFLKDYKVGLLHGKMNKEEKKNVMDEFRKGSLQVLVSTTVIEVGVDVPNATVMVIEELIASGFHNYINSGVGWYEVLIKLIAI